MMHRLLICFSLAAALDAASIQGKVRLVDSREPDVRKKSDFSGVAVWLEPVSAELPPAGDTVVKMLQKNKRFEPHLVAIRVGGSVDFPNLDPIFHNAFSNFSGQPFDVGLYAPGSTRRIRFRREGIVRVFCNIHPTMSAVIVVLKTPYSAVSQPDGAFSIQDVAPGDYRLHLFHERASEERIRPLERDVKVAGAVVTLPEIVISESGYLQAPHKNKYGKDYPAVVVDMPAYPGRQK
jgi:plastocyanin